METNDYFMNELRKISFVIAKLLNLKMLLNYNDFKQEIRKAYEEAFSIKDSEINESCQQVKELLQVEHPGKNYYK